MNPSNLHDLFMIHMGKSPLQEFNSR